MRKPPIDNPDRNFSAGYGLLETQEPLPPYDLDSIFDDPVIRKRVVALIVNAAEQSFRQKS